MAMPPINIGDLAKPATTLIEKVSDAVGGIARPWQIKRVAQAEAEAEIIRANARIQISELERRGLERLIHEEGQKQDNIEQITFKAIPDLSEHAEPDKIENDWLSYFFDRCRTVSDQEMQSLWAKILASQANKPGSFSKRAIELVSTLDKADAQLFTQFCTFCWMIGDVTALVFDIDQKIYAEHGANFGIVNHLDDLGLLSLNHLTGFSRRNFPKYFTVFYFGKPINIEFSADENTIDVGKVLLTRSGAELAAICGASASEEYFNYVIKRWYDAGYILSSPLAGRPNGQQAT